MSMRNTLVAALCVALLAAWAPGARAQGATSLSFLKIGLGARAAAMGQAMVSVADDADAAFWNPAGVAGRSGQEIGFNHVEWFQDVRFENAAWVWGTETQGLGVSATIVHVGNLEERDASGNYLGDFRYFDNAIGVSYSREVAPSVRVGLSGKFLREQIDRESASTTALDAGVLMDTPMPGLSLGAALSNVGQGLKFIAERDPLPTTFAAGASYRLPGALPYAGGALLAMDVSKTRDANASVRFGAEIGVAGIARYRVGYITGVDAQDFGTGFGVKFDRYRLDYAFVPSSSDLGDTHRFSFNMGF